MSGSFSKISTLTDLRQSLFGRDEEGSTARQKVKQRFSLPGFYGDSPCVFGISNAGVARRSNDNPVLPRSGVLELIAEVPESSSSRGRSRTPRRQSHRKVPLRSRLGLEPDASVFYDLEVFDASAEVRIGPAIESIEESGTGIRSEIRIISETEVRSGPGTRLLGGSGTSIELGCEGSRSKSGVGSGTGTLGSRSGSVGGVGSGKQCMETGIQAGEEGAKVKDLNGLEKKHPSDSTKNGSDSDVSNASSVFDVSKTSDCSAVADPPFDPSIVNWGQSLSFKTPRNLLRRHGERIVRSIKKRLSFAGFSRNSESTLKLDATDSLVPPHRSHSCSELPNAGPRFEGLLQGLEVPWGKSVAETSKGDCSERVSASDVSDHTEVRIQINLV